MQTQRIVEENTKSQQGQTDGRTDAYTLNTKHLLLKIFFILNCLKFIKTTNTHILLYVFTIFYINNT